MYKNLINLFKINFNLKGNLKEKENLYKKKWNKFINSKNSFTIHDGPPFSNGDIHLGHIFNKILKDIILKYKIILNYKTNFILGWDCHGIPIENKIEENLNINNKKFIKNLTKNYVILNLIKQKKNIEKFHIFNKKKYLYNTINYKNISEEIKIFKNFFIKKYIYNNYKPMYWCFKCKSNLSLSEIFYKNTFNLSVYLYFSFIEIKNLLKELKIKNYLLGGFIIWTTNPWTIISNECICLNKNSLYCIFKSNKGNFLINCRNYKKFFIKNFKLKFLLKIIKFKKFNKNYSINPLFNLNFYFYRYSKLIISKKIKTNIGTGLVHLAPNYGYDDFLICKKYNLKFFDILKNNGFLNNNIPKFKNLKINLVNKNILRLIKLNNKNIYIKKKKIKYMYCSRHLIKLIYKSTLQWFLKVNYDKLKFKKILKKKLKKIKFFKNFKKYFKYFKKEWNISRQRIWGVPIVIFLNKKNKLINILNSKIIEIISSFIEIYGIKYWKEFFKKDFINKSIFFKKIKDIFDVWFDSGNSHWCTLKKTHKNLFTRKFDLFFEGKDQIKGWFRTSIITSIFIKNSIPFRNLKTHGFILNKKKEKFSKSLNNFYDYKKLFKFFSIDIIRLWIFSLNYNKNIIINEKIFDEIINVYIKLRNFIKYIFLNISDFKKNKIKIKNLDRLFLFKFLKKYKKLILYYKYFNFKKILKKIENFIKKEIFYYFNLSKDFLYLKTINSKKRKIKQLIFYYLLKYILKILFPVIPFTSEECWDYLFFNKKLIKYKINLNKNFIKNININNFIKILKIIKNKLKILNKKNFLFKNYEINIIIFFNKKYFYNFYKNKNFLFKILQTSNIKIKLIKDKNNKFIIKINKKFKCKRCFYRKFLINFKNNNCLNCYKNLFKQNNRL